MITTYKAASDIDVLTTNFPIPGLGQLAINSFVLQGAVVSAVIWRHNHPWMHWF